MIPQWTNDGRNVHSDSGAFSANGSKMTVVCPLLHQIPNIRMLQFYMRSNLGMVNIGDLIILIW